MSIAEERMALAEEEQANVRRHARWNDLLNLREALRNLHLAHTRQKRAEQETAQLQKLYLDLLAAADSDTRAAFISMEGP